MLMMMLMLVMLMRGESISKLALFEWEDTQADLVFLRGEDSDISGGNSFHQSLISGTKDFAQSLEIKLEESSIMKLLGRPPRKSHKAISVTFFDTVNTVYIVDTNDIVDIVDE